MNDDISIGMACDDPINSDLFYPERGHSAPAVDAARDLCARCPNFLPCYKQAITPGQPRHRTVRAGMSGRTQQRIRKMIRRIMENPD